MRKQSQNGNRRTVRADNQRQTVQAEKKARCIVAFLRCPKKLFKSATGRALEKAFGKTLCRQIFWIHTTTDSILMAHNIAFYDAQVVLLFGIEAIASWDRIQSFKDLADLRIGRTIIQSGAPLSRGVDLKKVKRQIV